VKAGDGTEEPAWIADALGIVEGTEKLALLGDALGSTVGSLVFVS